LSKSLLTRFQFSSFSPNNCALKQNVFFVFFFN
jgi:hypothetical protein